MGSRGRTTIHPGDVVSHPDLHGRLIVHRVLRSGRYVLQLMGTNKLYFATRTAIRKVPIGKPQVFLPGMHGHCSICGNDYVVMTVAQDGKCLSCMFGHEEEKLRIVTGRKYDARAGTRVLEVEAYGERDEKIPIFLL